MTQSTALQTPSPKAQRDSGLELFRIFTMLLIIAHHYVVNSGFTGDGGLIYADIWNYRSIIMLLFGAWGKTGINCFIMITGYFMCKSNISTKKFFKLLLEVYFYRLCINALFWITGYSSFSTTLLLKYLLPFRSVGTGFTSAYLVFFLFIPFLNILLRSMNEKQHIRLLLLMFSIYVVMGTFRFVFTLKFNYVSWFIVVYFFAAYIRLYPHKIFSNRRFWGLATVFFLLLSATSVVLCAYRYYTHQSIRAMYFVEDSNTFLALANAFCAFMFFKNVKLKYNPIINALGSTGLGVLLIHAQNDIMRKWLWKKTLRNVEFFHTPLVFVHAVGSVLLIYLICACIDILRIKFLETPFFKLWDKYWPSFMARWTALSHRISAKLHIS